MYNCKNLFALYATLLCIIVRLFILYNNIHKYNVVFSIYKTLQ